MPYTESSDIDDLLFTPEMFGVKPTDFPAFVQKVIDEQADLLEGRIGSTAYASSLKPNATFVKKAEKCLVAVELLRRRKTKVVDNAKINGQEFDTRELNKQLSDYQAEADMWIGKIAAGAQSDGAIFTCGALVSDHFGGNT